MKSRTRRSGRELDLLDRLKNENKRLKQQVAQLRKLITKFDLDRYNDFKDVLEANERLEAKFNKQEAKKELKRVWECWDCGEGILKLTILPRRDGTFYWRCCSNPECGKRTKTQPYTNKVQGIRDEE